MTSSNSFQNLTEDYLKTRFSFNPIEATASGYSGYDEVLPNFTNEAIQDYSQKLTKILTTTESFQPHNQDESIDLELLNRKIKNTQYQIESARHHVLNPSLFVSTLSDSLFHLMMLNHFSAEQRCHFLMARMKQFNSFIQQAKTILKDPVSLWTQIAIEEIPGVHSYLVQVILPYLEEQKVIGASKLVEDIRHDLYEFQRHLEQIKTQDDFAIGADNFSFILKNFHALDLSVTELRALGYEQIDILTKQIHEQAEKIDADTSWEQLIIKLKDNHPSEKNLLKSYQAKVDELKQFLVTKDLVTLPKEESLSLIETPAFLQSSIPFAAYSPPTMFAKDSRGLFFVSPAKGDEERLKEHCFAAFPLTALHEAYPGHHLQFATQRNLKSTMRRCYDIATYYEGWTLYCEQMMSEQGFCDDGMKLYQLKDRLWRAARIVVDVSMHCFGMSDSEAAAFLVDQAKLSTSGARVDVNWYTQSPTTPSSYLVGALQVERLKEDALKQGLSLKEFHDRFLSCGAIPLKFVRQMILQPNEI